LSLLRSFVLPAKAAKAMCAIEINTMTAANFRYFIVKFTTTNVRTFF